MSGYYLLEEFPDGNARILFGDLDADGAAYAFGTYCEFLHDEGSCEVTRVVVVKGLHPGGFILAEWKPEEGVTWPVEMQGKWRMEDGGPRPYSRRN